MIDSWIWEAKHNKHNDWMKYGGMGNMSLGKEGPAKVIDSEFIPLHWINIRVLYHFNSCLIAVYCKL